MRARFDRAIIKSPFRNNPDNNRMLFSQENKRVKNEDLENELPRHLSQKEMEKAFSSANPTNDS